jgi:hypothetical protein
MNSTAVSLTYEHTTFIRIGILGVDPDEYTQMREHPGNYTDVPKSIHVCGLAWCMKKYDSATVINGVLREKLQTKPPPPQDVIGVFEAEMINCKENLGHNLTYKVLGGQQLDLEFNDGRLSNLFRGCPDIMKISEEENLFVVNYNDERYIR